MGAFVVSGGDGAGVLECCKDILDEVSGLIQVLIVLALFRTV